MTNIQHIQPDSTGTVRTTYGRRVVSNVFWVFYVDKKTISEARQWFDDNYGLQQYQQHWGIEDNGKEVEERPAFWIIDNNEIAMAFKLIFCNGE